METIAINEKLKCLNDKPLKGNDVAPPLKEGEKYSAKNVIKCSCGKEHIDVGLVSDYNYITCYDCSEQLPDGNKIHWCHPSRFEKDTA